MRPLTSDELGRKGEERFAELCVDAQLICNRSDRDRTGWDFFVEFPFARSVNPVMLDSRPLPIACLAQVKTVWTGGRNVKIRLSSAERLAKHCHPSFIFVLSVNNALQFEEIYCIHIIDEALAKILEKIRCCQATDPTKINKTYISLNYILIGTRILVKGQAVADHIKSCVVSSQPQYIQKKIQQIENLGVFGNRFSIAFTIPQQKNSEFVNFALGLKKMQVVDLSIVETRWGIPLSVHADQAFCEVLIAPNPLSGRLTIRDSTSAEAINILVDIIVPAIKPPSGGVMKFIMRSSFIEISVEISKKTGNFKFKGATDKALPLEDHMALNKALRLLVRPSASFELHQKNRQTIPFKIENIAIHTRTIEELDCAMIVYYKICNAVICAGGGTIVLSSQQINTQLDMIFFVDELVRNPSGIDAEHYFQIVQSENHHPDLINFEILVVGQIKFSNAAISICAIGEACLFGDAAIKSIKLVRLRARRVQIISLDELAFDDFCKEMQAETGIGSQMQIGRLSDAHCDSC